MLLPTSPTDSEKYSYIDQNKKILYILSFIASSISLYGVLLFTGNSESLTWFLGFFLLSIFWVFLSYTVALITPDFSLLKHMEVKNKFKDLPPIDIYLPNAGENLEIIANTFKHVSKLDYDGILRVICLDDIGREEVRILAELHGFDYVHRPDSGWMKKAGNLRHAFNISSNPFFIVFDADFCPRVDFIKELLPYFSDSRVAIVQSPQYFRVLSEMTWVEKGAAYSQESFYRVIETSRDYFEGAICVGTNAIYRRVALEPFGGTALIGHSEDMHTGFNAVSAGYRLKYGPLVLARGLCPDNKKSFFNQQYRWCMGSGVFMFDRKFWTTPLKLVQRLTFLTGMLYYSVSAIMLFIAPLPPIILIWFFPHLVEVFNAVYTIPSLIMGFLAYPLWSRHRFDLYVLSSGIIAHYAYLRAFVDALFQKPMEWKPSGTSEKSIFQFSRYQMFVFMYYFWLSLQVVLIVEGARRFDLWVELIPTLLLYGIQVAVAMQIAREDV